MTVLWNVLWLILLEGLFAHICVAKYLPETVLTDSLLRSEEERHRFLDLYNSMSSEAEDEGVKDEFGIFLGRLLEEWLLIENNSVEETLLEEDAVPDSPDCAVLHELYVSAGGGSNWGDASWKNVKTKCCSCTGVSCNENNRVSDLVLYDLVGHLPDSLWNMTELEKCILVGKCTSENVYPKSSFDDLFEFSLFSQLPATSLVGAIPKMTTSLPHLRTLVLSGSFDKGCVHFSLSSAAVHIKELILTGDWECDVSDFQIPLELETLQLLGWINGRIPPLPSSLLRLSLKGSFGGELTDEMIRNLNDSIYVLDIEGNFVGPLPLSVTEKRDLSVLSLAGNFWGEIPYSMNRLSNITVLSLVGSFEGEIPTSIGDLIGLTDLYLFGDFQGALPSFLNKTTNLSVLELVGSFDDEVPYSIGDLQQLERLCLVGRFRGVLPDSLQNIKKLKSLEMVGNFEGKVPDVIGGLDELRSLQLVGNFVGDLPRFIVTMTNLLELDMVGNFVGEIAFPVKSVYSMERIEIVGDLNGTLPISGLDMPNLKFCSICCNLNIPTVNSLSGVSNLVHLDLAGNSIYALGDQIAELRVLEIMILDHCNISSLPNLSFLPKLRFVSLSHNNLTDYGDLFFAPSLEQVDLSHNRLDGPFTAFSRSRHYDFSRLTSVDVSNNLLTEFVLVEESALSVLTTLDFSVNDLHGSLSNLMPLLFPSLRIANFSRNSLSGEIPTAFHRFNHLEILDLRGNSDMYWNPSSSLSIGFIPSYTVYETWKCEDLVIHTALGTYTLQADDVFQNYKTCKCLSGYFGKPPYCQSCSSISSEATCPGDGGIYAPLGYWATPPLKIEENCFPEYVVPCSGAGTEESVCRPHASNFNEICREGYTGRLCSGCDDGYFEIGLRCLPCMQGTAGQIGFYLLVIAVVVIFIFLSFSNTVAQSGTVRILIVFLQNLYYVWSRRSGWGLMSVLTSYFIRFQLVGPSCFIDGWNFAASYALYLLTPLVIMVVLGIIFLIGNFVLRTADRILQNQWKDRCEQAVVFVIYFQFVGLASELMLPIPCERDEGLDEDFMTNLPSERCDEAIQITSIFLVMVVVGGIPFFVIWKFVKNGRPQPDSPLHLLSIMFRRSVWMWEVVITSRRVLVVFTFLIIPAREAYQSALLCLVLGASLGLQAHFLPFKEKFENLLESVSIVLLMVNYGVVLQFSSPETNRNVAFSICLFLIDSAFVVCCLWEIIRSRISAIRSWYVRKSRQSDELQASDMQQSLVQ